MTGGWQSDSETMELTVGSFDDPSRFRPIHNDAAESILPAWQNMSHLPSTRSGGRSERRPSLDQGR